MNDPGESALTPTGAFELLTHDTRMAAMRVLWEAEEPLRFSDVAERAGISDTGNFNYHFGKLVGHFVRGEGERYALTRSGRRAMTAVLAGDVTEPTPSGPVSLAVACPYCGADVELHYGTDELRIVCPACPGTFEGERETPSEVQDPGGTPNPSGTVTTFPFPAAGLRDREPGGVIEAALLRLLSRFRDVSGGVCPDCAGPVELAASVCRDHDPSGMCPNCGSRFAGTVSANCGTCRTTVAGLLPMMALSDPRLCSYFAEHGADPLDPTWEFARVFLDVEERIRSLDPIDYEANWSVDGERLRVRLDDDATVTDVVRE